MSLRESGEPMLNDGVAPEPLATGPGGTGVRRSGGHVHRRCCYPVVWTLRDWMTERVHSRWERCGEKDLVEHVPMCADAVGVVGGELQAPTGTQCQHWS